MSISNSQLISDSLGLLGVLQETEVMTAEHGLRTLNDLMADWEQDGIDLQYFEQSSLPEDAPIPNHAVMAVKYYLAMALAPFYAKPVPPEFLSIGAEKYARLRRDAVKQYVRPTDLSHLPDGSGWGARYDIMSDR
jgi:hypothetical protein